ncbi:[protein-PII] uridylyltransferase [Phytoactinopolyspora halotolerans]|uniref:Bifunctional uridylyltransferase/uridylyl-removing enzyme n=1 Tax=Phytoactinopolyspora halotolerans TaxID=1981512 RepID=A0A6L9S9P2_9ACTN|nr:[protein-PII] uridylyltransferase [Phytoactinopolyspora halotolerans]NEE01956.1 [protein-PII] uridylyltransferase [Phytoactinopolyspora halotolerans]
MSPEAARFAALRRAVIDDDRLGAARRRSTLSGLADAWLARFFDLLPDAARRDVAVVAVGGYGRQELLPGSDLDVLLLLGDGVDDPAPVAEQLFYPVWDAGVPLDHSVRTVGEALDMARGDLKVALGLIDARQVAGDAALTETLVAEVRADWRRAAGRRLPLLAQACRERAEQHGELSHLLEPDLVQAYGGLRDSLILRAVAATWVADRPHGAPVEEARNWLLTVRDAMHRAAGRRSDRLLFEDQADIAERLLLPDPDTLLRRVAEAGRHIAYASDVTWREVDRTLASRKRRGWRRRPLRRPLAEGVVEHDGEAVLARDARPDRDAVFPLRAAAAAAQAGVTVGPQTVRRLAAECPQLPDPWPEAARNALVSLLGAGHGAVPVWDSLDAAGLVVRWIPEWARIRYLATRTPVHRHTVDRHLVETAAVAAGLVRRVTRPDLLLLAALFHDLGKGLPGDHSKTGAKIVRDLGHRLGLPAEDCAILGRLVRHHLLLPEVATRRDPDDPKTLATVVEAVGDREFLELLYALTEADATAAGPLAWSPMRARLVGDLVARARGALDGAPAPHPRQLEPAQEALTNGTLPAVRVDDGRWDGAYRVTVAVPPSRTALATVAGVLALNRLDVRAADTHTVGESVVMVWDVVARHRDAPNVARLREELVRAAGESNDVGTRLAARTAERRTRVIPHAEPQAGVLADASSDATVLEVRAHDEPGLLHRLATVVTGCGVVIRSAVAETLGSEAIDVFYLVNQAGAALSRTEITRVLSGVRSALAR